MRISNVVQVELTQDDVRALVKTAVKDMGVELNNPILVHVDNVPDRHIDIRFDLGKDARSCRIVVRLFPEDEPVKSGVDTAPLPGR